MRCTKSFWNCMLWSDRTPNLHRPNMEMEFMSLREHRAAPTKLEGGAQTTSSDLRIITTSCLCFSFHGLHMLTEKYLGLCLSRFKTRRRERWLITSSCREKSQCILLVLTGPYAHPWANHNGQRNGLLWLAGPEWRSTPGVSQEAFFCRRTKDFWTALATDVQSWFLKCFVL